MIGENDSKVWEKPEERGTGFTKKEDAIALANSIEREGNMPVLFQDEDGLWYVLSGSKFATYKKPEEE